MRKIYESPDISAVIITLNPGESLRKHVTPVDVFFSVLEGTGIVETGDERQSVGKNSVVESPAMIAHTWINESGEMFRVMVVKILKTGKGKVTRLL